MLPSEILVKVETLQRLLISRSTGGEADEDLYVSLRKELLEDEKVEKRLPRFVKTCRDLSHFWDFIKPKFPTYQERRAFLRAELSPVIQWLEQGGTSPADAPISDMLSQFDVDRVHDVWVKALERRATDPEGAITTARTLLETVCKRILDENGQTYDDDLELPKLYNLTALQLNLAPSQHTEQIFKQILGNCQSIVESLGAIRNRLGDAHGKGKPAVKPASRHAELAVNLAGAVATFLVATWEARQPGPA